MTPKQVKANFEAAGMPVSSWAKSNGFRPTDVYRVLNGQTPCKRGLTHQIAVKLGIKPDPNGAGSAARLRSPTRPIDAAQ